mmetsp:Transcript_2275/g.4884  ORF Transcript_2275/g.4884 Transcript_2275/m.4884 type:complete len:261 (+) Transcript_2275:242-1024(+)
MPAGFHVAPRALSKGVHFQDPAHRPLVRGLYCPVEPGCVLSHRPFHADAQGVDPHVFAVARVRHGRGAVRAAAARVRRRHRGGRRNRVPWGVGVRLGGLRDRFGGPGDRGGAAGADPAAPAGDRHPVQRHHRQLLHGAHRLHRARGALPRARAAAVERTGGLECDGPSPGLQRAPGRPAQRERLHRPQRNRRRHLQHRGPGEGLDEHPGGDSDLWERGEPPAARRVRPRGWPRLPVQKTALRGRGGAGGRAQCCSAGGPF